MSACTLFDSCPIVRLCEARPTTMPARARAKVASEKLHVAPGRSHGMRLHFSCLSMMYICREHHYSLELEKMLVCLESCMQSRIPALLLHGHTRGLLWRWYYAQNPSLLWNMNGHGCMLLPQPVCASHHNKDMQQAQISQLGESRARCPWGLLGPDMVYSR